MRFTLFLITLIFILCFLDSLDSVGIQCVDENGTTVDWLILYKLPNTLNNPSNGTNAKSAKNAKNRLASKNNKAQPNGTNTKKDLPSKGATAKKASNGTNAEKPFNNGTKKNLLQSGQVCIPALTVMVAYLSTLTVKYWCKHQLV